VVKIVAALVGILSLLGVQADFSSLHHHHLDAPSEHRHHDSYGDTHFKQEESGVTAHVDSAHDDEFWHSHKSGIDSKPERSNVTDSVPLALLPTGPGWTSFSEIPNGSVFAHPFVPFATGPPGQLSSRGPPVP
jgi:hypothetical protein